MSRSALPAAVAVALLLAVAPAATARMLPFPDDAYTHASKQTASGRVLAFRASQMPRNAKGTPIDPKQFAGLDGFSPGSVILAKVTGLDDARALERTGAVSLTDLSRYARRDAPVLVLDAKTGRRWPIWVELDDNAKAARDRLLEIHPARNLLEGRRYVVVLRNMRTATGKRIAAPGRAVRSARLLPALRKAKVARGPSLYRAWDFTVASRRSLSERMLHIRDDAFRRLGDANLADRAIAGSPPAYTAGAFTFAGDDTKYAGRFARVIDGTLDAPCYLDNADCGPGGRYALGSDGLPRAGATAKAHFLCVVPDTATGDDPARLVLYGHGLLGSDREVLTNPDIPLFAREGNAVLCATPWAGMSSADVPNAVGVLQDFSRMSTLADGLQQGMLHALLLGRLMTHPAGLASNALFQDAGGRPIVRSGALFYDGNSEGAIVGGALTALAPDYERAVLGVPGMNFSVLLPRSRDFDVYSRVLYPAYPREIERPLVLDLAQLLWDRGEADGYAQHMTSDPLPGTPRHEVLLHVANGDQQVTQYQADVMARTIGARIHAPAFAPGRSPQSRPAWGIPALPATPFGGSAIVYWDSGAAVVGPPPLGNTPNRSGSDPHEHPRRTPAARRQKAAFLQQGGTVVDECGGAPCLAAPDVG